MIVEKERAADGSSGSVTIGWPRWPAAPVLLFVGCLAATVAGDADRPLVILLLALVAPLAYLGVALLLNSTRFGVADGVLTVRHGPLPWRGRTLAAASIEALEVRARASRRGPDAWELAAVLRDGSRVVLLGPPGSPLLHARLEAKARALAELAGVPLR